MRKLLVPMICLVLTAAISVQGFADDELAEIRVHGNYKVQDREVINIAGVAVGDEIGDETIAEIRRRLLKSGKFEEVRILKRYKSLDGEGPVVLVIVVREKEKLAKKLMFMPILELTDEYGFTYGVQLALDEPLGLGERLALPLSWGGEKRAAVEAHFDFGTFGKVVHGLEATAGRLRRENPHYEIADDRYEIGVGWITSAKWLRGRFDVGWANVRFDEWDESFYRYGAGIALDTRQDVNLPRDAVYLGYGWERLNFRDGGEDVNRHELDIRAYKGLIGQPVLAGQLFYRYSDGVLPPYQKPFLGGGATLRGHKPGAYVGDSIALASLELRVPLTPLSAYYRYGVNVFMDSGAVFDYDTDLGDADFHYGAGVGAWIFAAIFGLKVELAHDLDDSMRFHFSTGFRF